MLKRILIDIDSNETVILDGANHFKGMEAVGGKLVLTENRLIFKSHKHNIHNHEESISIDQIKSIRRKDLL